MLDYELYLQLQAVSKSNNKRACTEKLERTFNIDYRTAIGITKLLAYDKISFEETKDFIQPGYYTMNNVMELSKSDFECLIPLKFYENDEFLTLTGITELPSHFIHGCQSITSFHLSKHITSIGQSAFFSCGNLIEIAVEERSEPLTIHHKAFYDCVRLSKFNITTSVYIENEAFMNCLKLPDFKGEILSLGEKTFFGCIELRNINLSRIKVIPLGAFHDCIRLNNLAVTKVQKIAPLAFQNCYSLEKLDLHNIIEIDFAAFQNSGLKKVLLNGINLIEENVFQNCKNLKEIIIQSLKISDIKSSAFDGCTKVENLQINDKQFHTPNMNCYEIIVSELI